MFRNGKDFMLLACWQIFLIFLCVHLTLSLLQVAAFPRNGSLAFAVATTEDTEANALLKWKASFDKNSQAHLSSWTGTKTCNWKGIVCDKSNPVSKIDLANYGLKELAHTLEVNEKCDVYSFGVLTLEIIMGKHPGDLIASLMSPYTASEANDLLLIDVLNQRLPQPMNSIVGDVILIARLAFACLSENPRSRPTMDQVSK